MKYLKCADPITIYVDPVTRFTIGRNEIAAVERVTTDMAKRLRKKGLLEVNEEAYLAQEAAKKPAAPEQAEEVKAEEPAPVQAEPELADADLQDRPEVAIEEKPELTLPRKGRKKFEA